MPRPETLRFGIQSLDQLIGTIIVNGKSFYGIDLCERTKHNRQDNNCDEITSSICLTGPDGTGKSVFSLHIASRYLADCLDQRDNFYPPQMLAASAVRWPRGVDQIQVKTALPSPTKVFYISTDLTYEMALKSWHDFGLDAPCERREPLLEARDGRRAHWTEEERIKRRRSRPISERSETQLGDPQLAIELQLRQYFPAGDGEPNKSIVNYLEGSSVHHVARYDKLRQQRRRSKESQIDVQTRIKAEVCFVDLASRTAGDDWGFAHRLLSTLQAPLPNQPRHLVVMDAIEGFETLVGGLNAFGEKSTRRSRIAQVMRLAASKCHLVFVIEETHDERLPEEFVTDGVIRLRNVRLDRYVRRTVEVEKVRGQWHIRGQHPFVIREGKSRGSTSGGQNYADDPEINMLMPWAKRHQSYVHVFPSLDYLSRETINREKLDSLRQPSGREHTPRLELTENSFLAFGIRHLDNMLGRRGAGAVEKSRFTLDLTKGFAGDPAGLPAGSVTALIGDPLTQKSQLGKAFLSHAFLPYAKALAERIRGGRTDTMIEVDPQFAVMFTTKIMDTVESLAESFCELLAGRLGANQDQAFKKQLKKYISYNTICRRFEMHDLPAPVLMHIFQRNIERAQRMLFHKLHKAYRSPYWLIPSNQPLPSHERRAMGSWRIRVVIDDLNGFRDMFPEMREDPLMLPMLLALLNREGVTTLIIDTQTSGSPDLSITERFDSAVRELVQHHIYVWRLPFYGENRVAITLIPPISNEYRGIIRELRWDTPQALRVPLSEMVDPNFELYMGLEQGRPQPVPLQVQLFAETPTFKRYIETEERLFREVFVPVLSPTSAESPRVITWAEASDYDALRDSSHLQRDTRIEHTTIVQVDEFWWLRRAKQRRTGAFRSQANYLGAITSVSTADHFEADLIADPFEVFQPPTVPDLGAESRPANTSNHSSPQLAGNAKNVDSPSQDMRRLDFFDEQCGYELTQVDELEKDGEADCIDRVPFTWDFGFLLCNESAWDAAADSDTKKTVPPEFQPRDLLNARLLADKLSRKTGPISAYLAGRKELKRKRWNISRGRLATEDEGELLKGLNRLLESPTLYDKEAFGSLQFSDETREQYRRARRNHQDDTEWKRFNRYLLEDSYPDEIARHQPKVKHVWERLRKVSKNSKRQVGVSWREFLAASKVVAESQSYRTSTPATAFDFTMLMPEAFSCLILEMWVSEIYDSLSRRAEVGNDDRLVDTRDHLVDRLRRRRWRWKDEAPIKPDTKTKLDPKALLVALMNEKGLTLEETLRWRNAQANASEGPGDQPRKHSLGHSLELYKVWLLLVETLNFSEVVDSSSHLNFEFKSRDTSQHAVTARHWYKTASKFIDSLTPEQLEDNWVPVRLPGHFSVRADWFLAVAGGSRSSRLADHALDLLSSKRANVTRLQEGIGLPTRRLFEEDAEMSRLRTRLISIPEPGKPLANVEYEKLRQIGASSLFFVSDITEPLGLIDELWEPNDPEPFKRRLSVYLRSCLSQRTLKLIERFKAEQAIRPLQTDPATDQKSNEETGQAIPLVLTEPSADQKSGEETVLCSLVKDLNKVLLSGSLLLEAEIELKPADSEEFLSAETGRLLSRNPKGADLVLLNRMVLEDVFHDVFLTNRFHWLWRSGIWAYNRHSRIWQKWLNRLLLWWHSLRQRYGSNWTSGFKVYDMLTLIESSRNQDFEENLRELTSLELESWKKFHEMRDILIAELEQVTTLKPDRNQ